MDRGITVSWYRGSNHDGMVSWYRGFSDGITVRFTACFHPFPMALMRLLLRGNSVEVAGNPLLRVMGNSRLTEVTNRR
jgi:hypothetical protein